MHAEKWNLLYIAGLNHLGIRLSDEDDNLFWSWNKVDDQVNAKLSCEAITSTIIYFVNKWRQLKKVEMEYPTQDEIIYMDKFGK